MQGIESLDNFKKFVSSIGGLGRYEDTYIVHAAEGETVVPMEVFNKNPVLKERLFESMRDMGIEPERYVVGNELNSINPITGQPEFFLKNIGKFINRVMPGDTEKYLPIAAGFIPGMSTLAAAGIGAGIGAASAAGRDENILRGALTGGLMGGATRVGLDRTGLIKSGDFLQPQQDQLLGFLGRFNPFKKSEQRKALDFLNEKDTAILTSEKSTDFAKEKAAERIVERAGTTTEKGVGTLGSLGTLAGGLALSGILGSQIPKPQDATIDRSKIYQPPKTDEFAFNPNMQFTRPEIQSPLVQAEYDPTFAAEGGVMDLRQGGESEGPGTGTSDDIPAMLSDGEFVMTAKAVRGAGGGDRREGAKRMYEAMDKLEAQA
jgi:hypothetical protein